MKMMGRLRAVEKRFNRRPGSMRFETLSVPSRDDTEKAVSRWKDEHPDLDRDPSVRLIVHHMAMPDPLPTE